MNRTVSATEARIHFGELMRWVVDERAAVVVERGGKPLVVVLPVAEYERLCAGQPDREDWRVLLDEVHEQIESELAGRELPSVDDIIYDMREERDAQLLDHLR